MILCLGTKGCGKTVLLKRLQETNFQSLNSYSEIPATVSTVGTNIVYVKQATSKESISIIEIGGEMSSIWQNYFEDCSAILYVIDSSDLSAMSESCLLLINIIKELLKLSKPLYVILSKADVKNSVNAREMLNELFFLESYLEKSAKKSVDFIECSCVTGKGLKDVYEWVLRVES
ncbi:ADP-ribosylation factor-like protein 16 [Dinothrombium tinctorium]|uniref:ADP-ribosylation factor-like protein 16 n=1 Tax=Dinothrombium tinctorium TaxID=1965070 RepID=A0A3S3RXF8_9ACAR|nr:ADP-ribosylation factor-like protein 16 [Dinothrombium tinctorium]